MRIDRDGNIWVVDVGAHVVLRMNPAGRVTLVLGRRRPGKDGWLR